MKKWFFVLALFPIHMYVQGQNPYMDSLKFIYQNNINDTLKILTLVEIGNQFCTYKPDTVLSISEQVLKSSEKISYNNGRGWANFLLGRVYHLSKNYEMALFCYQGCLETFGTSHNTGALFTVLFNIGSLYYEQGNYILALKNYKTALSLPSVINNPVNQANILTNIAFTYYRQSRYDSSLKYSNNALKIWQKLDRKPQIIESMDNIANIYKNKANYTEAILYYHQ